MGRTACTEPQCLYMGALGPTQPPVQWVPGLSRGKERPARDADSLPLSSAVVIIGYSYTSTPPMGRTACTEPQCLCMGALGPTQPPVQWVPGFSLGKERPGRDADSLPLSSAVVMKVYSYTCTPPMGRTACTEPQCFTRVTFTFHLGWASSGTYNREYDYDYRSLRFLYSLKTTSQSEYKYNC